MTVLTLDNSRTVSKSSSWIFWVSSWHLKKLIRNQLIRNQFDIPLKCFKNFKVYIFTVYFTPNVKLNLRFFQNMGLHVKCRVRMRHLMSINCTVPLFLLHVSCITHTFLKTWALFDLRVFMLSAICPWSSSEMANRCFAFFSDSSSRDFQTPWGVLK